MAKRKKAAETKPANSDTKPPKRGTTGPSGETKKPSGETLKATTSSGKVDSVVVTKGRRTSCGADESTVAKGAWANKEHTLCSPCADAALDGGGRMSPSDQPIIVAQFWADEAIALSKAISTPVALRVIGVRTGQGAGSPIRRALSVVAAAARQAEVELAKRAAEVKP